jgi:hypothetical protein
MEAAGSPPCRYLRTNSLSERVRFFASLSSAGCLPIVLCRTSSKIDRLNIKTSVRIPAARFNGGARIDAIDSHRELPMKDTSAATSAKIPTVDIASI